MEFNEVIDKRVTSREWTNKEVPFEVIKRIIGAGMKVPSSDHMRQWAPVVVMDRDTIQKVIGIPKDYILPVVISVGYPVENAEVPTQVSATVEEKVHWNKW